ncbi:hypothetical protein Nepgr_006627 [Nepenthes gracilis]|uniref:Uncharacterized protein n=1 Tax=Nepenthes gracilis TaxID=150966 RepID=A0AAD3S648_NEPGR|nr:hypothetical protein Nepgr_006627 [Nepenthes gracilis]
MRADCPSALREEFCCGELFLICRSCCLRIALHLLFGGLRLPVFLSFADYGMAAGLLWCIGSFAGCLQMVSYADLGESAEAGSGCTKSRFGLANADMDYAGMIWISWVVLVLGWLSCKWESEMVEVPVIFSSIPCVSALGMAWLKA